MPYTVEEREQIVASERLRIVQFIEEMRDGNLKTCSILGDSKARVCDDILNRITKGDGK